MLLNYMQKKRYTFIYIILTAVVIGIFAIQYLAYKRTKVELENRYNKELMIIATQLADNVSSFIDELRIDLKAYNKLIKKNEYFYNSMRRIVLQRYYEANAEKISGMFITSKDGDFITLSYEQNNCIKNYVRKFSKDELHTAPLKSFFRLFIDEEAKCYFVLVGEPITLESTKENVGYLLIAVSLESITEKFIRNVKIGEEGYAWIIDNEGTLISNPKHQGMLYRNIFKATKVCYSCHESFDLEKRMAAGETGFGSYYVKTSTNNQIAYYPIELGDDNRWSLAVIVPQNEIAKFTDRLRLLSVVSFELIFGTVLLGGFILFREKKDKLIFAEEAKCHLMMLESREKFEAILNSMDEILFIVDPEHNVTFANLKALEVLGDISENKFCYELLYKKELNCRRCPVSKVFSDGAKLTLRKDIITRTGETKSYIFNITPEKDEAGNIVGAIELGHEAEPAARQDNESG